MWWEFLGTQDAESRVVIITGENVFYVLMSILYVNAQRSLNALPVMLLCIFSAEIHAEYQIVMS